MNEVFGRDNRRQNKLEISIDTYKYVTTCLSTNHSPSSIYTATMNNSVKINKVNHKAGCREHINTLFLKSEALRFNDSNSINDVKRGKQEHIYVLAQC